MGSAVAQLQGTLQLLGYLPINAVVDGQFGPQTETAVNAAKADFGMAQDGIADYAFLNELADIDEAATDRFIRLTDQLAKAQGITEALKAENMLLWIQRMNAVREQTDEIVLREFVYA